ncbi:MAG: imidazoleglycerol-phosphate dehydratase HisB [Bacillota bacterium]|nr:imidazoleglycerol-phosphate dehydratase HisB [Bacillota bacterium]
MRPEEPGAPGAGAAPRRATVERVTRETRIRLALDLDGEGSASLRTGLPFFEHLLDAFARHGLFDLEVEAEGDLEVDAHHTVEDVGLCLGRALGEALGDHAGIRRFGWAAPPMDETLVLAAVDLSGRPFLDWGVEVAPRAFGLFHSDLAAEFWRAFAAEGRMTLHLRTLAGAQPHHVLEATWKAAALALRQAVEPDPRRRGVPSTKGWIEH